MVSGIGAIVAMQTAIRAAKNTPPVSESDELTDGRQGPPHDPDRDGCGPAALLLAGKWLAILATISFLAYALTGFRQ